LLNGGHLKTFITALAGEPYPSICLSLPPSREHLQSCAVKRFITYLTCIIAVLFYYTGTRSLKSEGDRCQDDEAVLGCDPQLPILLRILYEKGQQEEQEQAMHLKKNPLSAQPESPTKKKSSTRITYAMLELGIAQSLCVAIQSSVGDATSATSITAEVVTSLVELLHR
jgi:hypothetical protein